MPVGAQIDRPGAGKRRGTSQTKCEFRPGIRLHFYPGGRACQIGRSVQMQRRQRRRSRNTLHPQAIAHQMHLPLRALYGAADFGLHSQRALSMQVRHERTSQSGCQVSHIHHGRQRRLDAASDIRCCRFSPLRAQCGTQTVNAHCLAKGDQSRSLQTQIFLLGGRRQLLQFDFFSRQIEQSCRIQSKWAA